MVYIDQDGRVLERRPWNLSRILSILTGLWFMAVTFFSTLLAPFTSSNDNRSQNNERRNRWGSGGGGGGGGPGGGGGGGDGGNGGFGNRRIGRINTTSSMNCPSGGCCG